MDKAWFEMRDRIRRPLASSVWIPLRRSRAVRHGDYGTLGFSEDYEGAYTLAVPLDRRDDGELLAWMDLSHDAGVYAGPTGYKPAEVYERRDGDPLGVQLALAQHFDGAERGVWHLNQDLAFALRLLREGDVWLCPSEGYVDVVRLARRKDGTEESLDIRAEFLRDYLAARNMALRIVSYQSRTAVLEDAKAIGWDANGPREEVFGGRFEGRTSPIHEGGHPFGATAAVFHVSRTDVDLDADVPVMGPEAGGEVKSRNWTVEYQGRRLWRVEGEFWRNEWVEPAARSRRVRGDDVPSACTFAVSAGGDRANADELCNEDVGQWLWFTPGVVEAALRFRGSGLEWFTRETGSLSIGPGRGVHFGMNERALLNTYAYDVARLPEWQRRIWAGFNVVPDGGVSAELLQSQVKAEPADTQAPESYLGPSLTALDRAFRDRWGQPLMRGHDLVPDLLQRVHRFRALDDAGVLALAKDLARLTADHFDTSAMHMVAPPAKGEGRGSLKSLERVLATLVGADNARALTGPLVGIYDLRLGDAHLPSSAIDQAFGLARVDRQVAPLRQGFALLDAAVSTLLMVANVIATGVMPVGQSQ